MKAQGDQADPLLSHVSQTAVPATLQCARPLKDVQVAEQHSRLHVHLVRSCREILGTVSIRMQGGLSCQG